MTEAPELGGRAQETRGQSTIVGTTIPLRMQNDNFTHPAITPNVTVDAVKALKTSTDSQQYAFQ